MNIAILLLLLLTAATSLADDQIRPFIAHYEGKKKVLLFTVTANARVELTRTGQYLKYVMDSTVKWSVFKRKFYDCSLIRLDQHGMKPLEYLHVDESNKEFNVKSSFDWESNKAVTVLGSSAEPTTVDITWPTWDPMSFQVALMSAAPVQSIGKSDPYQVLERGKLKQHQVTFNGDRALDTRLGNMKVYEIISRKTKGGAALWLAPDYGWIPARITIDDVTIDLNAAPASKDRGEVTDNQVPHC
ncbi:MAG: DUF3108 domain-containing protein [Pseudomonadota bacterium]